MVWRISAPRRRAREQLWAQWQGRRARERRREGPAPGVLLRACWLRDRNALDDGFDPQHLAQCLSNKLSVLPAAEGVGQSLGLDPEQQTLAVVVQDLGVLGQEGPGGTPDGEDLGQNVGPGSTNRIRVDAARYRRGPWSFNPW